MLLKICILFFVMGVTIGQSWISPLKSHVCRYCEKRFTSVFQLDRWLPPVLVEDVTLKTVIVKGRISVHVQLFYTLPSAWTLYLHQSKMRIKIFFSQLAVIFMLAWCQQLFCIVWNMDMVKNILINFNFTLS